MQTLHISQATSQSKIQPNQRRYRKSTVHHLWKWTQTWCQKVALPRIETRNTSPWRTQERLICPMSRILKIPLTRFQVNTCSNNQSTPSMVFMILSEVAWQARTSLITRLLKTLLSCIKRLATAAVWMPAAALLPSRSKHQATLANQHWKMAQSRMWFWSRTTQSCHSLWIPWRRCLPSSKRKRQSERTTKG